MKGVRIRWCPSVADVMMWQLGVYHGCCHGVVTVNPESLSDDILGGL